MGADGPVAVASIVSAAVIAAIAERWAGRGTLGQGVVPPPACLHGRHTKGYGEARVAKGPVEPRRAGLVVTGNEKEEHVCLPPLKPHRHPFCTSLPRRDGGRESTGRRVMGNGEPPPFWVTACRASASREELTASAPRGPWDRAGCPCRPALAALALGGEVSGDGRGRPSAGPPLLPAQALRSVVCPTTWPGVVSPRSGSACYRDVFMSCLYIYS